MQRLTEILKTPPLSGVFWVWPLLQAVNSDRILCVSGLCGRPALRLPGNDGTLAAACDGGA